MLVAKNSLVNAGDARGNRLFYLCLGPRTWCRALIPALHLSPSLDSLPPLTSHTQLTTWYMLFYETPASSLQIPHIADKQQLHSSHCSDQTLRAILSIFVSVTPHMQFTSKSWLYPEPRLLPHHFHRYYLPHHQTCHLIHQHDFFIWLQKLFSTNHLPGSNI